MSTEWFLLAAALLAGLAPLLWRRADAGWVKAAVVLVGLGTLGGAWAAQGSWAKPAPTYNNRPGQVDADGYVSSSACRACHPGQYDSWRRSYHSTMTQVASPESVKGDFDDVKLTDLRGVTYHLTRRGDEFWVAYRDVDKENVSRSKLIIEALRQNLEQPQLPPAMREVMGLDKQKEEAKLARLEQEKILIERPVVQTTGSHHYQVYWLPSVMTQAERRDKVIEMSGYNLRWSPDALQGELLPLPFVYLLKSERWVNREGVFVAPPGPEEYSPWNDNCIKCHATHGRPKIDFEASTARSEVAEFGIACESCHGPGKQHIALNSAPQRRYGLHLSDDDDTSVAQPERYNHKTSSQICGQCHSISWYHDPLDYSQFGSRFRPGKELAGAKEVFRPREGGEIKVANEKDKLLFEQSFWSDGIVRIAGREFNGQIESGCYQRGEMGCTSCHQLHGQEPDDQLKPGMRGDKACVQCHAEATYASVEHTHHPAGSSGAECQNCHMPYTVFGLLKSIRSHYVDTPSVKATVETGRPNGCNICHMDKTLSWTDKHMVQWYGAQPTSLTTDQQRVSALVLALLKGDAGVRALNASNVRLASSRAASGQDWLAPFLAPLLKDPYHAVRGTAGEAIQALPGFEDFEYDYMGPEADREAAVSRAMEIWRGQGAPTNPSAAMLWRDGKLDQGTFDRLLKARDDRDITLAE